MVVVRLALSWCSDGRAESKRPGCMFVDRGVGKR